MATAQYVNLSDFYNWTGTEYVIKSTNQPVAQYDFIDGDEMANTNGVLQYT